MRNAHSVEEKARIFAEGYETPATPGSAAMNAEDVNRMSRAKYWEGRKLLDPNAVNPIQRHYEQNRGVYSDALTRLRKLLHRNDAANGGHPWIEPNPMPLGSLGTDYPLPSAGGGSNTSAQIHQSTTIHVHGTSDPATNAQRVADAQHSVNGRLLRNMRGIIT